MIYFYHRLLDKGRAGEEGCDFGWEKEAARGDPSERNRKTNAGFTSLAFFCFLPGSHLGQTDQRSEGVGPAPAPGHAGKASQCMGEAEGAWGNRAGISS